MAKKWPKWQNRWDYREHRWHPVDDAATQGWFKRTIIAAIIFCVVYGLHISGTEVGNHVTAGVKYVLSTDTELAYIAEKIDLYTPKGVDLSWLKRTQTVMTRPADPLQYMTKPVDGKLLAGYGWQTHPVLKQEMLHEGIDIEAPLGTSVRAAAPGKIKSVDDSARFGKTVMIEHGLETVTAYGHLAEILVTPGETVSQGQVIARVGKTGITSKPMLHFEVRVAGNAIDPLTRIQGEFLSAEGK